MEANQLTAEELAAIRAYAEGSADYLRNFHSAELTADLDPDDAESLLDFFGTDIPRLLATVEALRAENERLAKTLKEALMLLHRYTKSSAHDAQAIRGWMERTGAASLAHMSILREEPEA